MCIDETTAEAHGKATRYISNYGFGGNIKMSFVHSFTKHVFLPYAVSNPSLSQTDEGNTGGHDFREVVSVVSSVSHSKKPTKDFLYLKVIWKMENKLPTLHCIKAMLLLGRPIIKFPHGCI